MHVCPDFEDRLVDYDLLDSASRIELDAHVATCAGCTEFQLALETVDTALSRAFDCPTDVAARVFESVDRLPPLAGPPQRPSLLPPLFDLAGWASLAGIGVVVTFAVAPAAVWTVLGVIVLSVTSWVTFEGLRELSD